MSGARHDARGAAGWGSDRQLPLSIARRCFNALVTGPQPLVLDCRNRAGLPQGLIPLHSF